MQFKIVSQLKVSTTFIIYLNFDNAQIHLEIWCSIMRCKLKNLTHKNTNIEIKNTQTYDSLLRVLYIFLIIFFTWISIFFKLKKWLNTITLNYNITFKIMPISMLINYCLCVFPETFLEDSKGNDPRALLFVSLNPHHSFN